MPRTVRDRVALLCCAAGVMVRERGAAQNLAPTDGPSHLLVMAKAIWENTVIAESDKTIEIEGNQYFPADGVKKEYFAPSAKHSECPWKGTASYYDVKVNGKTNADAAWFYPEPKEKAKQIQNYVAFWKGVRVEK